jgi:universal stress protein A
MLSIRTILCPIDFSDASLEALHVACEYAEHFDAHLRVLHVVPFSPPFPSDMVVVAAPSSYPSDTERFEGALRQVRDVIALHVPKHLRAHAQVKMGYAPNEIVCAAEEDSADIIIMGTHGASGWRHLAFGSVAEKVVRMARRPVLTIHSQPVSTHHEVEETEQLAAAAM